MQEDPKKTHKFLNFIIAIIVIIVSLIFYSKFLGVKGLIVKEYRINSNILTSNFDGIKIIHFSDLLYKSTINKEDVDNLIKKINLLKPDLVFFTGDLINKDVKCSEEELNYLTEKLKSINSTIGKYAVYGENDYKFDYEKIMKNSGFIILNNTYEEIYYKNNELMYIVGIPPVKKEKVELDEAFSFYKDENRKFTIALIHDGKTISNLDKSTYEVDLILGGHSLNGSVVLPFYGGIFIDEDSKNYFQEHYSKGISNIYISSGLGTRDYGIRFNNKPSINLYRLKAQN